MLPIVATFEFGNISGNDVISLHGESPEVERGHSIEGYFETDLVTTVDCFIQYVRFINFTFVINKIVVLYKRNILYLIYLQNYGKHDLNRYLHAVPRVFLYFLLYYFKFYF